MIASVTTMFVCLFVCLLSDTIIFQIYSIAPGSRFDVATNTQIELGRDLWALHSLRPSDEYLCVSNLTIIAPDNDLSPGRRQAIIWNNAGILLIGRLGKYFNDILLGLQTFIFKKMHLNMSSENGGHFVSLSMCQNISPFITCYYYHTILDV